MSDDFRKMIEEHRLYYEVLPYYVVFEDGLASPGTRRIQAGFDVDIYGTKADNRLPVHSQKYLMGYQELQKIAKETASQIGDSCAIEVVPFFSTIFLDTKNNLQPQAMLRVVISHWRGLDQPAGATEERALRTVEKRLQNLGLRSSR